VYSAAAGQAGSASEPVPQSFCCGIRNLKAAMLANTFKRKQCEAVATVENLTEDEL
jgi:hypothetical protein